MTTSFVLLEDGTRFDGEAVAAPGPVTGEVVFNTAMSGYQEAVTDPSYAGQIITFTYPHVGNYGASGEAMESDRAHARAVIMRAAVNAEAAAGAERGWLDWLEDCGVPAITGVDTRALVRHLRDRGAMRGGIFAAEVPEAEAMERVRAEPPMAGQDLARSVSPDRMVEVGDGDGPRIAALDTGIKLSIVRNLVARGARVALHPCTAGPDELLAGDPDAIFLANGPGDPAALDYVVETVRELVGLDALAAVGAEDGEPVVLRRDLDAPGLEVLDRVVGAAVPEWQLERLQSDGSAQKLMAEADAPHRPAADQRAHGLDHVGERGGIAGAVGEKDRVGV